MNRERMLQLSPSQWAVYSLLLLVVIGVVAAILRANDPALTDLEKFLSQDGIVKSYVGALNAYTVTNTRYISEADNADRYNEYKIRVDGTLGSVTLKIRADYSESRDEWAYHVVRVYDS